MKLLILGGTRFVGKHITEAALKNGHQVTLFNRGKTGADMFPQAETLIGDRDGNLEALKGRSWDVVIDVNGYVPRIVGDSVDILKNAVGRYIFISTISVYADETPEHYTEDSPLKTLDDPTVEEVTGETYGGLKVLCEQVVQEGLPDNHLIIRPGLVFGPGDYTYRFNYWLARVAEGGEVLAPGDPSGPTQFVDVRDLAAWAVHAVQETLTGVYHVMGNLLTFETFLTTVREVSGSDARFVWASEDFLLEKGIVPFQNMPMWIVPKRKAIMMGDNSRAVGAGLTLRPIEETIRDTLPSARTMATEKMNEDQPFGISREWERELLDEWKEYVSK